MKLKKLFSVLLVLTIGTLGVFLTAQGVSASSILVLSNDITANRIEIYIDTDNTLAVEIDSSVYDKDYAYNAQISGGGLKAYIENETDSGSNLIITSYNMTLSDGITANRIEIYIDTDNTLAVKIDSSVYDKDYAYNAQISGGGLKAYIENETDSGSNLVITSNPILDNKVPVISGQTTFVANVDEERPLSYFMGFLSALDETDGDVTDSLVVVTDNYTQNIRVLGNHTFTVEASDESGNTATATINIRVVDIVSPVIAGNTSTAEIGYAETWNIESFRKTLSVTDNYQTMTNADIVIDTDGYSSNKTKLGTYTITFKATDESGNTGTFTKQVRVIDNVAPTFSGPTTIATSNNTVLTESDIRSQITANDYIDGNITNRIELVEDNFTGKGNKVGSYTLIYSVTDNAGNTATHTVTVQRSDKIPPTIWVIEGASIRTTPDTPISRDTIIDILEATGQIQINATTTFSFPLDEYSGNEETPGVYAMTLKARSTDGNESVHSFAIEVLDVGNNEDPITREPSEWIQDNIVWLIVGGVALIGGAYFITKRK